MFTGGDRSVETSARAAGAFPDAYSRGRGIPILNHVFLHRLLTAQNP